MNKFNEQMNKPNEENTQRTSCYNDQLTNQLTKQINRYMSWELTG